MKECKKHTWIPTSIDGIRFYSTSIGKNKSFKTVELSDKQTENYLCTNCGARKIVTTIRAQE